MRALLKGAVPVWRWNDMIMLDVHPRPGGAISKRESFDQIPAPDGQIEHAWRDLFAFQLEGRGYVPDQETLYQAWKLAMHKFAIDGGFRAVMGVENFLDLDHVSEDDADDSERELLNAVRSAIWWSPVLRKPTGTAFGQEEIGELDQVMTTAWVGKLVLQHMSKGDTAVDAEQFITEWRNLLPEKWSVGLGFDVLDQESYHLETDVGGVRIIRWLGEDCSRATNGLAKEKGVLESVAKDSKPEAGVVGKRKWHEKFKDSRNIKK
jgi:Sister chromatid cohesion protein Dcc1